MKLTKLGAYWRACQDLAQEVSDKYADGDVHWMGSEIGGVAGLGDAYLDMTSIATVAELDPTVDRFWDAYWAYVDEEMKVSFRNLVKFGVKHMRDVVDKLSLCKGCYCSTKTINSKCGKCKADKTISELHRNYAMKDKSEY